MVSARAGRWNRKGVDEELDAQLSRFKAEHQEVLYVRVIIPQESGLSYNEAWSFTSEIHGKYDYY